uniref:Uncharacterized protein n=1 Tax=Rhizophora mucronata TaxID=61149 RepID=A0A2P2N4A8_RHIMU
MSLFFGRSLFHFAFGSVLVDMLWIVIF